MFQKIELLKLIHFACLYGSYTSLQANGIDVDEDIEEEATEIADRVTGMLGSAIDSGFDSEAWLNANGFNVFFEEQDLLIWNDNQKEFEEKWDGTKNLQS